MGFNLKCTLLPLICAALLQAAPAADYNLPDIGTAGIRGLTVQREEQVGRYYTRMVRGNMPVVDDPVMNEYMRSVGNKLVMNADNVRFPFRFFIISNPALNASAFLGGVVNVHTGLFHYADSVDEFASVIAHEITHVTQRHIARFIESQSRKSSLTLAGMIGSVAMSIINPAVGMAALSGTMGVSAQSSINFTRENEAEADRIGLELLYRAGYNPAAMSDMFKKLMSGQGSAAAYAMLMDHPLSQTRAAEAAARAAQYPARRNSKSAEYEFARARTDVRYMQVTDYTALKEHLEANPEQRSRYYRNYALALVCFELKQYNQAREYLSALGMNNNIFVLDLLTDLDLESHNYQSAISRLNQAYTRMPSNEAVVINLANALIRAGQHKKALSILKKFADKHPENSLALQLMSEAYLKSGDRCSALQSSAGLFALSGNYNRAMNAYNEAMNTCTSQYSRDITRALITRLSRQREFDENINKGK